jgi:hypothetical protein
MADGLSIFAYLCKVIEKRYDEKVIDQIKTSLSQKAIQYE